MLADKLRFLILLSCIFTFWTVIAKSCDCIEHPVCSAKEYSNTVFTGVILSSSVVSNDGSLSGLYVGPTHRIFRIRVTEALRGNFKVGAVVEINTGMSGGDCGYRFQTNESYLVDAESEKGQLYTGICSHTALLSESYYELRFLRALSAHQKTPEIYGYLNQFSANTGEREKLHAHYQLKLSAVDDKRITTVQSDDNGYFEFSEVPDGVYRLKVNLPSSLQMQIPSKEAEEHYSLSHLTVNRTKNITCRLDLFVGPTNSGSIQ